MSAKLSHRVETLDLDQNKLWT